MKSLILAESFIRIIEVSDDRGSDNRGSTVLRLVYVRSIIIHDRLWRAVTYRSPEILGPITHVLHLSRLDQVFFPNERPGLEAIVKCLYCTRKTS